MSGTKAYSEAEEKVLEAALQVVNEATISGTRMHLIAEKAGMVQSNVHYYYKTKQELMESLQEWILQEFYALRQADRDKGTDTLEGQLHAFFQQKKILITKKKLYDFAELNFLVDSKINPTIHKRFQESYTEWRDSIREVIIRYCPRLGETEKELIPHLAVSLLEGASIQMLIDGNAFDADGYFEQAEAMVLGRIEQAAAMLPGQMEQAATAPGQMEQEETLAPGQMEQEETLAPGQMGQGGVL